MARKDTRLGLDLTGAALAGLVLKEKSSGKGAEFHLEKAYVAPFDGIRQVGGAWVTPPAWPDQLKGTTDLATVGVLDVLDSISLRATDVTNARDAVTQANNLREQFSAVTTETGFNVPVPRGDGRWGLVATKLDAANVLQVVQWAAELDPNRNVLIDVPVIALLRAIRTLGPDTDQSMDAIIHIDLWRTYVVLRQSDTERQLVVHRPGLAQLAATVAGKRNATFEDTLRALCEGEGWDASAKAALAALVDAPLLKARRNLNDQEIDRRNEGLGVARATMSQVRCAYLSGPLADIPALVETVRAAAKAEKADTWRPVAYLKGANQVATQRAGWLTIALGHALNERPAARPERLPLDYTLRVPLAALAAEHRHTDTIVAMDTRNNRQKTRAKVGTPLSPERLRQIRRGTQMLWFGVSGSLIVGLGMPLAQQTLLRRQNLQLASDTVMLSSEVLNLRNVQDEVAMMDAKRNTLASVISARTEGVRIFAATSRAIGRSHVDVWLTAMRATTPLEIQYDGTGRSASAIASFLDGLRADGDVRGVALQKMTRDPKGTTWSFTAKALLSAPPVPTLTATPSAPAAPTASAPTVGGNR